MFYGIPYKLMLDLTIKVDRISGSFTVEWRNNLLYADNGITDKDDGYDGDDSDGKMAETTMM